jgi:DNA-binding transcriptional LysR family regulator
MTAAATELFVSQSAISLAIGELEKALGAQLLIRHRARGLELTPAGRRLLPEARDLLAHAEDVRAIGEAEGGALRGALTVGCFRTAAPFLLPQLLVAFAEQHPEVTLDFLEGPSDEIEQAMLRGRCEIAILYDLDIGAGIATEPLRSATPYVLLSPQHRLARRRSLTIADVAGEDMIMLDVPPSAHYFGQIFAAARLTPRVRHRASSYELVRSLVARDLGYALLLSRPEVDVSYEGLPLKAVPLRDDPLTIDLVLAWPAGVRLTRRARTFGDLCRRDV